MRFLKFASIAIMAFILFSCKKDEPLIQKNETPHDFLSSETYKNMIVEIKYIEGYKPNEAAVNNAVDFMNKRLYKPNGISVSYSSLPPNENVTYSADDIRSIEEKQRTQFTEGSTITLFVFYADKEYSENTDNNKTLGVAYGYSSIAIFKQSINEFSGGLGQPSEEKLESAILKHEIAHILGLVNTGTEMQQDHEDSNHKGHCDNENCLMYYTAETNDIFANITGSETLELDNQCITDLQANGGK